jgi:hypothetical protein
MTVLIGLLLSLCLGASVDAPADQYFGKLGVSTLRIRYEIMQLRPRYETHRLLPEEAEHLLVLDENAFYAWAAAYPKDAWLASTGYMLAQLFAELPGGDARDRAVRAYAYVKSHFPSTTYGKQSAAALHRGVPVRPDPDWAAAARAARASPSPSPSASPSAPPSASPAASAPPSPLPGESPLPGRGGRRGQLRNACLACTISSPLGGTRFPRGP